MDDVPRPRKSSVDRRFPLKVTLIYAMMAGLWILLSDHLLFVLVKDPAAMTRHATHKGWLFVLITALLLHTLVRRNMHANLRTEEALRRSEAHYRGLYDAIASGVIVHDAQDGITHANQAACEILGLARSDLEALDPDWRSQPNDASPDFAGLFAPHRAGQPIRNLALDIHHPPTNSRRSILINTAPILDPETGALRETVATFVDITHQTEAEEARREGERFLHGIFDAIQDGISVLDRDLNVLRANRAMEEWYPHASPLVGRKCYEVYHGRDESCEVCPSQRVLRLGIPQMDQFPRVSPEGVAGWREVHAFPLPNGSGEVTGVVEFVRDVTERRRAEEAIRTLNEELERRVAERTAELETTNRELESFSQSVSHDLRAPLRAIDRFSQAIMEDCGDTLDDQARDYLQRIHAASKRMGQLITDLLKLSHVVRGEMRRERVNLSTLAQAIGEELQKTRPEREVRFVVAPRLFANGDARLLRILLENLLDNAWKFTSTHARAKIEFGAIGQNGERVFYVRDDGAGFDMAYADKLFGAFQRLHGDNEFPGTGIGLATVQRIIHRHGGRAWAEGKVEQGATIYFTLETTSPNPTASGTNQEKSHEQFLYIIGGR